MKIAVVGKGGSGKSTVSTLLTLHFAQRWKKVLAIDADYNMDMAHHLLQGDFSNTIYMNTQKSDFFHTLGITPWSAGNDIVQALDDKKYTFPSKDFFTDMITQKTLFEKIELITLWWLNDEIIWWEACSHSYYKSLKHYLGWLEMAEDSLVIIDSVAWTDMVGYGLYVGVDALINVVEDTHPSINVSKQIQHIAEKLQIPFYTIGNKRKVWKDQQYASLGYLYEDIWLIGSEKILSSENNQQIQTIIDNLLQLKKHSSSEILERYRYYYSLKKQS